MISREDTESAAKAGIKRKPGFKVFDKNKDLFVEHSRNKTLLRLLPELALASYNEDSHITYLEFRIVIEGKISCLIEPISFIKFFTDRIKLPIAYFTLSSGRTKNGILQMT